MVPAVAVKVVEVAPAGTVTEAAGTGNSALLLERETAVPPAGAALFKVMVQLLDALDPTVVGLQANEDTSTGATSPTVAFAELAL
jgi:hypothetical protein